MYLFDFFIIHCTSSYPNDSPNNPEQSPNNQQNYIEHVISNGFNEAIFVDSGDIDVDGDVDILGVAFYGNMIAWWENRQN